MGQTPQSREDLLMAGLPPALCPGGECDWQSGHLLLQLPVCSSPWGAEVSEPFLTAYLSYASRVFVLCPGQDFMLARLTVAVLLGPLGV